MKPFLTILFGALIWATAATPAVAALPPFELVQKSVAKSRAAAQPMTLNLRVTQTSEKLHEFSITGTYSYGDVPESLGADAALDLRLLRIALFAADPIAELQRAYGFVNDRVATVGMQEDFTYVYGTVPSAAVFRDLQRLAAFSLKHKGKSWVVRIAWRDATVTGVMITRDGRTVLTARPR